MKVRIIKSIIIYFFLIFFISTSLPAQNRFEIGFSTGPSLLKNYFALSSQINLLFNLNDNFSMILNFEHLACNERKREIMLLSKMRYGPNVLKFDPYFELGLGVGHYPKVKETLTNGIIHASEVNGKTTVGTGGYSTSYEIGTGLTIPVSEKLDFDLNLSIFQTAFSEYPRLGFGLLYSF